jgi:hypothetical protein
MHFDELDFEQEGNATVATVERDSFTLRVSILDDEDAWDGWIQGEHSEDIEGYVGVIAQAFDPAGVEIAYESIWGIECLSGWSGLECQREVFAVAEGYHGVISEAEHRARTELTERAAMAARDIITI